MKDHKGTGLYVFWISLHAVQIENGEYPNLDKQTNTPIPSHPLWICSVLVIIVALFAELAWASQSASFFSCLAKVFHGAVSVLSWYMRLPTLKLAICPAYIYACSIVCLCTRYTLYCWACVLI